MGVVSSKANYTSGMQDVVLTHTAVLKWVLLGYCFYVTYINYIPFCLAFHFLLLWTQQGTVHVLGQRIFLVKGDTTAQRTGSQGYSVAFLPLDGLFQFAQAETSGCNFLSDILYPSMYMYVGTRDFTCKYQGIISQRKHL